MSSARTLPDFDIGALTISIIAGSICFLATVCGYLFVPELKSRSLEEIEVMFVHRDLPLRKFGGFKSDEGGVGAAISKLEALDREDPGVAKLTARVAHEGISIDE